MPSNANLRSALYGRLKTLVLNPVHPIAWENMPFQAPADSRWLRATLVPTGVRPLGLSGLDENLGLLQIDVFDDAEVGSKRADLVADAVAAHFERGLRLSSGSTRVTIRRVEINAGRQDEGMWQLPVSIYFRSLVS